MSEQEHGKGYQVCALLQFIILLLANAGVLSC